MVVTRVRAQRHLPGTEELDLCAAAERVLAEDVAADRDSPAVARSVRDGYAVRALDLLNEHLKSCPPDEAQSLAPYLRSARRMVAERN